MKRQGPRTQHHDSKELNFGFFKLVSSPAAAAAQKYKSQTVSQTWVSPSISCICDFLCVCVCLQYQGAESGPQLQFGVSGEEGGGSAGQTRFSGESAPAGREQAEQPVGPGAGPYAYTAERGAHTH